MGRFWRGVLNAGTAAVGIYAVRHALRHMETQGENREVAAGKRILILGAGFGGSAVATELSHLLRGEGNGEITLVDADNYLLFTPMLTEAAGGELDTRHIVGRVQHLADRVKFIQGQVIKIDVAAKSVTVLVGAPELDPVERTLWADHVVIGLGSVTSYHHIPGVEEHSFGMKKLEDAAVVRKHALKCLERAALEDDPEKRKSLMTFVVGGGGFTGVETMAALNDMMREVRKRFPALKREQVRTVLIHQGDRLLPEITGELSAYAQKKLVERGVVVQLNREVSGAGDGYVEVKGEGKIPTRTLIWTAGETPSPAIATADCKKGEHGGIVVDSCCQVPGHPGIWALGDNAEIPNPDGSGNYAPTAQNATREGKQIARNIVEALHGCPAQPFRYTPMGELALVGRRTGVARVFGWNFSGVIAWAMWRAVYLAKMPDGAQQIRILMDWIFDMTLGREITPLSPEAGSPAERAISSDLAAPANSAASGQSGELTARTDLCLQTDGRNNEEL